MNIAIFTNNYLPNIYGVPMSIETFRLELEKRGHRVYVFAPKWRGYHDSNPRVFRYPSLEVDFRFRLPLSLGFSAKIDAVLAELDLDIIHAQHPNLLGSAALRWARKKKIPLIFTWHTLYDKYTNFVPLIPEKVASRCAIGQAVNYANKTDYVITPTESIVPILRKWGVESKIASISTGVKEGDFLGRERELIRRKYGIKKDEILLFSISRLTDEKNVFFLFRSVAKALEKNQKIKFIMAGDGYWLSELEEFCWKNKISDRVFFPGLLPRNQVGDYFSAADLFVYASQSETQGIVVLEAMQLGLPVVAVRATGIVSLVRDRENGLLVDQNEEDFSAAILELVKNEKKRRAFGAFSQKIVQENYTSAISAEKMLKIYAEAIIAKQSS